jgi:hypothetical protein
MPDDTAPRPNLNTYWVVPYRFLAGEYPGDKDPGKAREKINRFLEVGVRHFNGSRSETSACRAMHRTWLRFSSRLIVG